MTLYKKISVMFTYGIFLIVTIENEACRSPLIKPIQPIIGNYFLVGDVLV